MPSAPHPKRPWTIFGRLSQAVREQNGFVLDLATATSCVFSGTHPPSIHPVMRYLPVLFAFLLAQLALAQPTATPEEVGMSSERLERLDALMQDHVDAGRIAGGLSLVFRRGERVHQETYGVRDLEAGDPLPADGLFRIYSMSKVITTVAVMMLYEEGHFQLDTPVAEFLPEFADLCVYEPGGCAPLARPITFEHLITHTSGLSYGFAPEQSPVDSLYQDKELLVGLEDLEAFITELTRLPLQSQPGEQFLYSVSTDVLGRLVEVISGMPFDAFLDARLFGPLGMDDTGFEVPVGEEGRFVTLYQATPDGLSTDASIWGYAVPPPVDVTFFSGGAGMISTADDYLTFARMLLGGGAVDGTRILSPKTVELMMMNHLDVPFVPGRGFGLGGTVLLNPSEAAILGSPGQFSWSGAANTYFFVDPAEELIAFAWTQLLPYGLQDLRDEFQIAVYQAIVD